MCRFLNYSFPLLAVFLLVACSDSSESEPSGATSPATAESCELLMGWDPWEPYQFKNAAGEVTGLDVAVAEAVAAKAQCDIRFERDSWAQLLDGIVSGDIDLLGGATRTPAREDHAWFTAPYRTESFVLYSRTDNLDACNQASSLAALVSDGWMVGTVQDYYYGDAVAAIQADEALADRIVDSSVSEANLDLLLDREIDAFIEDPFVAAAAIRARGLGDDIVECGIELHAGDVSFMVSKAGVTRSSFENFEAGLQELRESGELRAIVARYRDPLGNGGRSGDAAD
ncbi:MAG: transporter substrate-binding domain-containing protein [Gammaproteobacteria bacterium]|nr:transporter substrate-binding domain-containing protein [Gammaproteobacteria bacterium]